MPSTGCLTIFRRHFFSSAAMESKEILVRNEISLFDFNLCGYFFSNSDWNSVIL